MAKILIVDDSQLQKAVVAKYLAELGHILLEAADGNQAYALALEKKPDLILMDIIMPDCNGFQATRLLQKDVRTMHIPIVMVSTKRLAVDRLWAEKQGAIDYVTKPIVKEELIRAVNNALQRKKST